jgi:hypothetical protein
VTVLGDKMKVIGYVVAEDHGKEDGIEFCVNAVFGKMSSAVDALDNLDRHDFPGAMIFALCPIS